MPTNNNKIDTVYKLFNPQDVQIKAVSSELGHMQFEGYLAVFNNVDHAGDVILPGAFTDTLKDIEEEGKTIPIIEMHDMWDKRPLGYFVEMKEDDYGLWVKGQLYSTDDGKAIHTILKESPSGSIGMSIGYRIVKMTAANEDEPGRPTVDGAEWYLKELKLREGSIVYSIPCNELAVVNSVKAQTSLEKRKFEKTLKEKGLSAKEAAIAVSVFYDSENVVEPTKNEIDIEKTQSPSDMEALKKLSESLTNITNGVKEKETSESINNIKELLQNMEEEKKKKETEETLKKLKKTLDNIV